MNNSDVKDTDHILTAAEEAWNWLIENCVFLRRDGGGDCGYGTCMSDAAAVETRRILFQKAREFERFSSIMPSAIAKIALDDNVTVLLGNRAFFQLTNHAGEKFGTICQNWDWLYKDDVEEVLAAFESARTGKQRQFHMQFRIVNGEETLRWLKMDVAVADEYFLGKFPVAYCVISDISELMRVQNELRAKQVELQSLYDTVSANVAILKLEKEHHQIISDISDEILFEYIIHSDVMHFAGKYKRLFGRDPDLERYVTDSRWRDVVFPRDWSVFRDICIAMRGGPRSERNDCRLKLRDDRYEWFEVIFKTLFDQGKPIKTIGKIANIQRVKLAQQKLLTKMQFDPLTNIYNRGTVENAIREYLACRGDAALLLVDVDKFKVVNDTLGHQVGDTVLKNLSSLLISLFRSTDVVGRLGGDEFVVFMKDAQSKEAVYEKAEELCSRVRGMFSGETGGFYPTVSVGVAFNGPGAEDFETLYQHADEAMYQAKKNGRDGWRAFKEKFLNNEDGVVKSEADNNTLPDAKMDAVSEKGYGQLIDYAYRLFGAEKARDIATALGCELSREHECLYRDERCPFE